MNKEVMCKECVYNRHCKRFYGEDTHINIIGTLKCQDAWDVPDRHLYSIFPSIPKITVGPSLIQI